MPPRKRKAKAREHSSDDSDAFDPAKRAPQKKKARTQEPLLPSAEDGHDEADAAGQDYVAQMTWDRFQKRFDENAKRQMDEYLGDFRNDLEDARNEILDAFKKARDALASAGTKQAQSIAEACQRLAADEHERATDRTGHPLFQAGQQIFAKCHRILEHHDKADRASARGEREIRAPGDTWQADNTGVQEVVSFGRQYGEKLIDCAITLDSDLEVLKVGRDQLPETGNMAIDLYKKSAAAVGGETWARTVAAQLNAVSALMDTISK